MNPAREVQTERFSRTEGKTPAFVEGEVQQLLDVIEASTHTGLRDRALLGVLAYTFARIGAVVNLKVQDYYPSGKTIFSPIQGERRKGERASSAPQVGGAPGRVPQSDRSRQRARLSCFLPLWAKPESFRAVRWCVPTPTGITNFMENDGTLEAARTYSHHKELPKA
jgi:integrase